MTEMDFRPFPKIPRLKRTVVVSEKIDGTNAQVAIDNFGNVRAGSRNRWITPESDNHGFARWVKDNEEELRKLGIGHHYGEWWGAGIQRRYGLSEKRFSLFNSQRWDETTLPKCCHVVPILCVGEGIEEQVDKALTMLREGGSVAAPGFMQPEGVVIYHSASRSMFKVLLENDERPKGEQ